MLNNLSELIQMIEVGARNSQKSEDLLRPYLLYFTPMLIRDVFNHQEYQWYHVADEVYIPSGKNEKGKKDGRDRRPDGLFYNDITKELNFVEYKTKPYGSITDFESNVNTQKSTEIEINRKRIIDEFCNDTEYENLISRLHDNVSTDIKIKGDFQRTRFNEFKNKPISGVNYYHICYYLDYDSGKWNYYIEKYDFSNGKSQIKIIKNEILSYFEKLNTNYSIHFHNMSLFEYCLNTWKTPYAAGECAILPYIAYMFNKYLGIKYIKNIGVEIGYFGTPGSKFKNRRHSNRQLDIGVFRNDNVFIMIEVKLKNGDNDNDKQTKAYKMFMQDVNSDFINYDNRNNAHIDKFIKNNCKAEIQLADNTEYIQSSFRDTKSKGNTNKKIERACLIKLDAGNSDNSNVISLDDLKNDIKIKIDELKKRNSENSKYFKNGDNEKMYEVTGVETILKLSFNNLINIIINESQNLSDEIVGSLKNTLDEITKVLKKKR